MKQSLRFFRYNLQRFIPITIRKMASTFVNIISRILTQPKSLTGIDPSQSNCLSSKMSFHIYGKKNFAIPKNIAAFFLPTFNKYERIYEQ